jgi:hypothetical protein
LGRCREATTCVPNKLKSSFKSGGKKWHFNYGE